MKKDWFYRMNATFLNSMEEVIGCFCLAGTTFFVCAYSIFLSYAIYDYQEEKPDEEKSPIDLLVKDLMHSQFWYLLCLCLIEIITLFTLPITSNVCYLITYMFVFLLNFHQISVLVQLYIQHVYVFYPDEFVNVDASIMRRKSIIWKFILIFFSISLNCIFPSSEVPPTFQMLTKGGNYER